MDLIDNLNFLRKKYPHIWSKHNFSTIEAKESMKYFEVVAAKSGLPTLLYCDENQKAYIHSKYDPLREGKQILSKYENIEEYDHVFFYGLGLGYHIEEFIRQFPDKEFSIYEPREEIFYNYLSTRDMKDVFGFRFKGLYIEKQEQDNVVLLNRFINENMRKKILLIFLPSYERIFPERFAQFMKQFQQIVVEQRASVNVNAAFEKRWTLNSLLNFPQVLKTPNILHDLKKEKFKNKPALLVAAGPSLEEDIENIRYIKEHGLAYIFSVGSAISVLINNNIYPDAACTYDPTVNNQKVFNIVVSQGITEIPLIFGSSVGFETLLKYPGSKAHMITSQDTLAPFLLKRKDGEELDKVNDSPSIAVVTLQMLQKLGFSPIILAGQNLAYKDDKRYAQGIAYYDQKNKLTEKDLENSIKVEDVYGGTVYTNDGFNRMRQQMEMYIGQYKEGEVINTTKGGANIKGTVFQPMEELIKERLQDRVVEENWLQGENQYDEAFLKEKLADLDAEKTRLIKDLNNLLKVFNEMNDILIKSDSDRAKRIFPKFDSAFSSITKNDFYKVFLLPMNRVQFELMLKRRNEIRFEDNQIEKVQKVIEEYGKFIYVCQKDLEKVLPLWGKVINSNIV
ncbi:MAG: 6-hydroxymethylpterin diphosphokinase MptE-like protein [Bacillota bacterium]|jgi:hypothetical protein|nr:motility associated factor glycosyltransferase family protein [Clostridia bacterium]